jgi:peptidoglycan hydrolase-like protein with peptidoglycan-binding domain
MISFLSLLASTVCFTSAVAQEDASLFPPNAEPGKCYAKVLIPTKYKIVKEEVIKHEAFEKIFVIPAQWDWEEKKVMVKEATEKLEIIPATYKIVEEKVEIVPPTVKFTTVKPVFGTVEEKIIDKPERTIWKKGSGLLDKVEGTTGDIMCLVNEPATYKTIKKQVLKTPATVKKTDIPGKYKIIKKQVIDKPAEVKKIPVPAEFKTVKVKKLVTPAQEDHVKVPEERQIITKRVKESDEKMSWRPVLCETNMTRDVIRQIQKALSDKGFDPGPLDGSIGGGTLKALNKFQTKNNLARGGLTYETLKALNVTI